MRAALFTEETLDTSTLRLVLFFIIGNGGAGILAYYVIDKWAWASNLAPEPKRYFAYALAGLIGTLAFLATLGMGYQEAPVGWRNWIEVLVAVAFLSGGVSQFWHAAKDL